MNDDVELEDFFWLFDPYKSLDVHPRYLLVECMKYERINCGVFDSWNVKHDSSSGSDIRQQRAQHLCGVKGETGPPNAAIYLEITTTRRSDESLSSRTSMAAIVVTTSATESHD